VVNQPEGMETELLDTVDWYRRKSGNEVGGKEQRKNARRKGNKWQHLFH